MRMAYPLTCLYLQSMIYFFPHTNTFDDVKETPCFFHSFTSLALRHLPYA